MERIVRIVTKNLISSLPSEREFFRLDQLRTLNIPEFIIDRIRVEMDRNLDDSIVPPYTEWADMKNRNVQKAWNDFIEAIRAEARLPSAYAHSVVESVVSDSLDMLIQPRKKIPEMMFGSDKALDRDTLEARAQSVVVYKHLAFAPVKYLYRKDLQALTVEQCSHIINQVDEKLVSRYNALNWAHLLEPLFVLLGDTIDTNLLRIFFQDKKRPKIARMFDKMSSSITRSGLIEALSSPELVQDPEIEDLKNSIYVDDDENTTYRKKADTETETGIGLSISGISSQKEPNDDNGSIPLHSRFMFDESAIRESESDQNEDSGENSLSFNAMFKIIEEDEEEPEVSAFKAEENKRGETDVSPDDENTGVEEQGHAKEDGSEPAKKDVQTGVHPDDGLEDTKSDEMDEDSILNETDPPDKDQKETYIWKNFLQEDYEDEEVDEERDRETIVEFKSGDENSESEAAEVKDLMNWLEDDRDRFVKELFKDSENAFEEAVETISKFDEWKGATRYIEKEIFSRNLIDMYDEVSVDFTDRLHSYFIEYKSERTKS